MKHVMNPFSLIHRPTNRRSLLLILAAGFVLASNASLLAATVRTWTGASATSGNWTTATNWSSGAPVAGDILSFTETGARKANNTNNFPAGRTFSTINVFGGGYRLRGNSVTISNYVTAGNPAGTNQIDLDLIAAGPGVGITLRSFDSSARLTLTGDINLNGRTLITDGPGDFILSGVISGAAGIRKDNTGDLTLSGGSGNTFTGSTIVNAGTLRLSKALILLPGPIISPRIAIPGDLVIGSGTGGLIGDIVVLNYNNQIADTSDVTLFGSGELALSGNSDTIASLTMTAGHLLTQDGLTVGTLTLGGNVQINSGTSSSVVDGRINLGSGTGRVFNVVQSGLLIVNAEVAGSAGISLVKSNRGGMFLTASNTFSGDVEIKGGILTVTDRDSLGTTNGVTKPSAGTLAIAATIGIPETLEVPGPFGSLVVSSSSLSASWLGPVVLNDDLNIIVPTNSFLTIVGQISGTAGWIKTGDGTLQFKTTYTNTYAGQSRVQEGNLIMDGVFNQPVIPGALIIGNATDPTNSTRVWPIKQNQIADNAPVTINRSGVLQLGGASDTVGPLTFNGGAVETDSGTLTLNGDILVNATNQTARISGNLALGGVTRTIYTLGASNTPDLLISAVISDGGAAAGFHKVGEGSLRINNANTFTGPVSVTDGQLRVANPNALGSPAAGTSVSGIDSAKIILEASGGMTIAAEPLTLNSTGPGSPVVLENFTGNNHWNGPITLLASESVINVPSIPRPLSLGGAISGLGGLKKIGAGILTLDGNPTNTFNGLTFVAEGDLVLNKPLSEAINGDLTIGDGLGGANADRVRVQGGGDEIWNGSRVIINSSGQLILDSVLDLVGSIEGSGNIFLQNPTSGLIVGRNDLSTTFDGVISGAGGFEKVGMGTLTFNGTHTFTGASGVSEGTLVVNGSIAFSTLIQVNRPLGYPNNPPAILAGNGTVPTIFPFSGGTVSPGTSPGRLTVQGNADLASSDLRIEINGTTPISQYDQLRVTGTVNLNNTKLFFTTGFAPTTNDTFLILDKTSPGPINGFFLNTTEGSVMGTGFNKYRITYLGGDGNDVVLRRVEIPGSNISSIAAVTPERMQILGQGVPFVTYILEATPTLSAPIPWAPVATNSANVLGIYEFIDAYADGGMNLHPARFYRVQSP